MKIKMRGLRDFKVPDFKFPKFKMKEISEIDEVKVDYDKIKKAEENKNKKEHKNYEQTHYKTIKEVFLRSIKEYADLPFILETPSGSMIFFSIHTEGFSRITV